MKTLVLFFVIASAYPVYGQELGEQVIITSAVGDTLNRTMRIHFGLFSGISGFKWAVFYLENDSILNARVHYLREGVALDTVIHNFGKLRSVHSALVARIGTELDSVGITMKDGTLVRGTMLGRTEDTVVVVSPHLGTLKIPRSQIAKVAGFLQNYPANEPSHEPWSFDDPNYTNSLVMPTANTLPAGKGYVGDYELVFLTGAVGLTDWLMINAGTLLIPLPAQDMVFDYGFKLRLSESPGKLNAAIGLEMASGPGTTGSGGIAYMVCTLGDKNQGFNIALGDAFGSHGPTSVAFGASGDYRISESIKLLGEFWYLQNTNWSPLVIGVRFFGSRLSGDIGLLYPIGVNLGSIFGFPVASINYSF